MLVGLVTTLDPEGAAAVDAGRAWGRHLVPPVPPTARVDALEALRRLDALMDEVGFAPETTIGPEPEVRLHHCPFLEVAQESPEVVCALHRGLMEGALDALGAPVRLGDLQPFDTPQSCLARLQ
jgi:predicted ArsR family transcriptional regulator